MSNLTTSTQYTFNIYAVDSYYNYVSSTGAITFYTMADVAGTPTIGSPTASTLPITIDVATNPSSTTYAIFNRTDSTYLDATGASVSSPVYQTSSSWDGISATGLSENTAYQFSVIARNGNNANSATSTASTAIYTLASVPSSVTATALSKSSIQISWSGNGTSYTLNDISSDIVTNITETSYTISNLNCNTTKSYKIKALNGDSTETTYSSTVSATTHSCTGGGSAPAAPTTKTEAPVHMQVQIPAEQGTSKKIIVGNSHHNVTIMNIENESITLKIESDPVIVTLSEDEEKKIDTNSDGIDDLIVYFDQVNAQGKAVLQFISINDLEFSINALEKTTDSRHVTLYLNSPESEQIAISNTSDFAETSFIPYQSKYNWILSEGTGTKTVYVRFRTKQGGTKIVPDTIELTKNHVNDTCELPLDKAYKSSDSKAVYFISKAHYINGTYDYSIPCTKRIFKNADAFYTYFTSWDDVKTVETDVLHSIPDDVLTYMPFGPLYNPHDGTLVRVTHDPRVYILLGTKKYWITSPEVFESLHYSWGWIEHVSQSLLDKYAIGEEVNELNKHPDHTIVKYKNDPKVYKIENQKRRWIASEETFLNLKYRWDRIVIISDSEQYEDGEIIK